MSLIELGKAEFFEAEAVGQPGQRRFRLITRTRSHTAILWAEKEQLLSLSLVIDQMLAQVSEGRILRTEAHAGGLPTQESNRANFPADPDYEMQVGQLQLGTEGNPETFNLTIVPLNILEDKDGEPQFYLDTDNPLSLFFTIDQAQKLTSRITALVQSGRPVCPLCHTPLDGGPHACIKQNGHREVI